MGEPVSWPEIVSVREVGPRDGIQSEKADVSTAEKIRLIDALADSGIPYIEAVSFVSPKAVPQMADALEVWGGIERNPKVFYSALVPNLRGAQTAIDAGVDGLQVFIAATDSYNLKNVRKTVAESMEDVNAVASAGNEAAVPVEGTISTAFGCPYEGDVAPDKVAELSRQLMDLGIATISFGDTTGMGTPRRVRDLIDALRSALPELRLNMHFHDTRGTGLANVMIALELGVDYFDSSIGGMGGSPFAEGATGNIATEDLVHMLSDMGIVTGIDFDALLAAGRLASETLQRDLPSKVLRAGPRWQIEGAIPGH
ncbi:MAG: hydroxymethylglutaryl-CoA lyase [Actinomycetota bacterium]